MTKTLLKKPQKKAGQALRIGIVGAGWSGLSAAILLTRAGHHVTLFDAAAQPGGRARSVPDKSASGALAGRQLDNGQHILLGAYHHTLAIMAEIGIDHRKLLWRLPLQMWQPDAVDGSTGPAPFQLQAPAWPMPASVALGVALLRAGGMQRADKMAVLRFFSAARWMGWQQHHDIDVLSFLQRHGQTERAINHFWRPVCVGALNTEPAQASVIVFLNVLRDALARRRKDSDMLIPRTGLGSLFADPAVAWLRQHEAEVLPGMRVSRLARTGSGHERQWLVQTQDKDEPALYDRVILATAPHAAHHLLAQSALTADDGSAISLSAFETLVASPIITCYLQYSPSLRLERPFYALPDQPEKQAWGQFVFDRGQVALNPDAVQEQSHGLLAVVISAADAAMTLSRDELARAVARQLATALQKPALADPLSVQIINEKRATHLSLPGLVKPAMTTGCQGLLLAGDYLAVTDVAANYPATLETAVRSGWLAALTIV